MRRPGYKRELAGFWSRRVRSRRVRSRRALFFQWYVTASVIAFAGLAYLANLTPYTALDLEITQRLQSLDAAPVAGFMRLVSWPGFMPQAVLVVLFPCLILLYLKFPQEARIAVLLGLFTSLLNLMMKLAVGRPRPPVEVVDVQAVLSSYSFPSGHVMFYSAFFGFLFFLSFTLLRPSWKRTSLLLLFSSLVLFIGPSRIYMGQHWASDVLGAYLLGGLCLAAAILLYRRLPRTASDTES
jgi:undecaprenyl-diphosphatase